MLTTLDEWCFSVSPDHPLHGLYKLVEGISDGDVSLCKVVLRVFVLFPTR